MILRRVCKSDANKYKLGILKTCINDIQNQSSHQYNVKYEIFK